MFIHARVRVSKRLCTYLCMYAVPERALVTGCLWSCNIIKETAATSIDGCKKVYPIQEDTIWNAEGSKQRYGRHMCKQHQQDGIIFLPSHPIGHESEGIIRGERNSLGEAMVVWTTVRQDGRPIVRVGTLECRVWMSEKAGIGWGRQ